MAGTTNLKELIQGMTPLLNKGSYVFTTSKEPIVIDKSWVVFEFKEAEGTTLVLEKQKADVLNLSYDYVSAWITLTIHSSLEAVGLTAIFSNELAKHHISCNVVAAYYHDHIFIDHKEAEKAMRVLSDLAKTYGK